ncbi:MAG: hypothetical protein PSV40_01670 [Polaromonas sp.]|uniref:hypothetical protein n=1 Tax=Polaromonas sp. TaxID=1869339 RepID=UPI002489FB36|nr:hypothetical protein [Polaromonas sp.]MDI1267799.1 hypothetical protein [Polaromonas sp.]
MIKKISENKAREWLGFLVTTKTVQGVIADALTGRYHERKRLLVQQASEVPAALEEQLAASANLKKRAAALDKLTLEYRQAKQAHGSAYQRAVGMDTTVQQVEGRFRRKLQELADPRIHILARWVFGLNQRVRANDVEWPTVTRMRDGASRLDMSTNAPALTKAMQALDGLSSELADLMVADYDAAELLITLGKIRAAALHAVAGVLNVGSMQLIEENAPDLSEITPAELTPSE